MPSLRSPMFLEAIAPGDWYEAVSRVRAAVSEVGFVLAEHPYSGVMVSFEIEVFAGRISELPDALRRHDVTLAEASVAKCLAAPADVDARAMLAVTFPQGDPDKTNLVPDVPG